MNQQAIKCKNKELTCIRVGELDSKFRTKPRWLNQRLLRKVEIVVDSSWWSSTERPDRIKNGCKISNRIQLVMVAFNSRQATVVTIHDGRRKNCDGDATVIDSMIMCDGSMKWIAKRIKIIFLEERKEERRKKKKKKEENKKKCMDCGKIKNMVSSFLFYYFNFLYLQYIIICNYQLFNASIKPLKS